MNCRRLSPWTFLWCLGLGVQLGMYYQYLSASVSIYSDHPHRKLEVIDPPVPHVTSIPTNNQSFNKNSTLFFPFTIRDARRLVPTQPSPEMQIFDYVDPSQADQRSPMARSQLFLNANPLKEPNNATIFAPCQMYSLNCYRKKILQVFQYVLDHTDAEYYFYTEADNEVCLPMSAYETLALQQKKYFISVGIGFSGWIMHRSFVEDFLRTYRTSKRMHNPDVIGAQMLVANQTWTVTRQYLVSHSILPSVGAEALTVNFGQKLPKHLPRCFEPRRAKWRISKDDTRDQHGFDYFDYDACPDADFYPCKPGQLHHNQSRRPPLEGLRRKYVIADFGNMVFKGQA